MRVPKVPLASTIMYIVGIVVGMTETRLVSMVMPIIFFYFGYFIAFSPKKKVPD